MSETYTETSNELNDASNDRAINSERDRDTVALTTDTSQDVDTQELIRSSNASFAAQIRAEDLADRVQARRHLEASFDSRQRLQMQLDAQSVRDARNAGTLTEQLNAQSVRHTDHTLIDLHTAVENGAKVA